MEEEWRTIKDYPHYAVSNMGRVKVLSHVVYYKDGRVRHNSESIKTLTRKDGYLMVRLFNKQGSKGTLIKVHRLVAQAFIPNPQNKPFIDHINTIRDDNRIENLRWVTSHENNMNEISRQRQHESRIKLLEERPELRDKLAEISRNRFKDENFRKKFYEIMSSKEVYDKRIASNKTKKAVEHLDSQGNILGTYVSTGDAARKVGLSQAAIWCYIHGKHKTKDKTIWRYKDEINNS